jgi:Bacterial cell division membrane protein
MAETVAPAWRRAVQAVDWTLLLLLVVLVSIGLIGIYSATSSSGMLQFFTRQLVSVGIGAGAFLIAALLPREWLLRIAPVFYAASIGLLGLVLLVGRTVYGSKSWLALGGMSFQPVELAKLGVILLVARLLSEEGRELQQVPVLLRFLLIVAVPMGLVLLQPDVGSATVFAALALVLLWWAGAPPLLVVLPILMAGMVLLGLVSRTAVLLGVVGAAWWCSCSVRRSSLRCSPLPCWVQRDGELRRCIRCSSRIRRRASRRSSSPNAIPRALGTT